MKLTIRTKDKHYPIETEPTIKIPELKQQLQTQYPELNSLNMRLISGGKFLDNDSKTLADYGVLDGGVLFLAIGSAKKRVQASPEVVAEKILASQNQSYNPQPTVDSKSRALIKDLLNQFASNPAMMEKVYEPYTIGKTDDEKHQLFTTLKSQLELANENPQLMDMLIDQMMAQPGFSNILGKSDGMPPMNIPANMSDFFKPEMFNKYHQNNAMPANMTDEEKIEMLSKQKFGPMPSPSIPCSHGYYPYLYTGPEILQGPTPAKVEMLNKQTFERMPSTSIPCSHGYYPYLYTGPQILQGPTPAKSVEKQSEVDHETVFAEQLALLEGMGFPNKKKNLEALVRADGNVEIAVHLLVEGSNQK